MNKERFQEIKQRLIEPFDPEEIKWRVTATSTIQTKHGPSGDTAKPANEGHFKTGQRA